MPPEGALLMVGCEDDCGVGVTLGWAEEGYEE